MSCSTLELTLLISSAVGFVLSEVIPFVPGSKAKSILQLLSNVLIGAGKALSPVALASEVSQNTTTNFTERKGTDNDHPREHHPGRAAHNGREPGSPRVIISQHVYQCQTCRYFHLGTCPEEEA